MGYLIYFFEYVCGLSGYLLGVNPFDQPGVEAYKKNMFALLGKPGYEEMKQKPGVPALSPPWTDPKKFTKNPVEKNGSIW